MGDGAAQPCRLRITFPFPSSSHIMSITHSIMTSDERNVTASDEPWGFLGAGTGVRRCSRDGSASGINSSGGEERVITYQNEARRLIPRMALCTGGRRVRGPGAILYAPVECIRYLCAGVDDALPIGVDKLHADIVHIARCSVSSGWVLSYIVHEKALNNILCTSP